ncbi:MAG: sigma-70 family RNA polymerase sigma factor [Bacteroidota bacterium]|nr:sigma-70 family RNA polymerase sigma factor [Bacteroidota bacterium]
MKIIDSFFEDFYTENFNKAFRYANSLVFDKESARDIASDAMLRIWEMRNEIDPDKNLCSFLFVTVRKKCMDYLRHEFVEFNALQQTSSTTEVDHLHEFVLESTLPTGHFDPELEQMVIRLMDMMNETTRRCFELVRLLGKSYEEAAELLNISTRIVEDELKEASTKMQLHLCEHQCA